MQWVAKREITAVAILVALLSASSIFLAITAVRDAEIPPVILTCFDSQSLTLRVTTEGNCRSPLVSLGSSALGESATATGIVMTSNPLLLARFEAARAAAEAEGVHLYITSGFRSRERQAILFQNAIKKYGSESEAAKWVLPPAYSHHPQGLALDINYPGDPTGAKWLENNGYRYGLCRVYANEWWHFEGVIAPGEKCPAMAENALVDMPDPHSH
jgi:hypothetical protein